MVGFFPSPYPDELFLGMICRLYKIMGHPPGHTFAKMLVGSRHLVIGAILPKGIKRVLLHFPPHHELTEQKIKNEHTLNPLYTIFTQEGVVDRAHIEPRSLFSCPLCRSEDVLKYGEAYWHRSHQVPRGKTCHKHNVPLEKAVTEYRPARSLARYFSPEDTEWESIPTTDKEIEIHRRFNGRIQTILTERPAIAPQHRATLAAMSYLAGYGHRHGPGRTALDSTNLLAFLKDRLGDSLIDLYCLKPDDSASKELLGAVIRGTEHNPHRYLLFYEAFDLGICETRTLPPEEKAPPKKRRFVSSFRNMAATRIRHRTSYLQLIENNPEISRTQIQKANNAAHKWLRRYDRAWFDRHHAKVRFGRRTNYLTKEEADAECVEVIKHAVEIAKTQPGVPKRLTVSYLARLLPRKERNRLKASFFLPRAKAELQNHQDRDDLAFFTRRVEWGISQVQGRMTYRVFCKLAALRPKIDQDPEIDAMAREAHGKSQEKYTGGKRGTA